MYFETLIKEPTKKEKKMIDLNKQPESIREAAEMYRAIKEIEEFSKRELEPYLKKKAEVESYFYQNLTIADGQEKSETISFPGVGAVSKKKQVVVKVKDWDSFQAYLIRNKMGGVIRHQANLAPTAELYQLIMSGELPMPKSAEFDFIEKLSFRKA
jgi:hypothetical protein